MEEPLSPYPIEQRFLTITGRVSPSSLALVREGLPPNWDSTTVCCFILYAYADIPIGTEFSWLFPRGNIAAARKVRCRIGPVTQQDGKPFDAIPRGWKTITLLQFLDGVPDLINSLPVLDTWWEPDIHEELGLATEQTWTALMNL